MKKFNFTQPFAMRCDAEQFESVKNELEGMGYEKEIMSPFIIDKYLVNNYAGGNCVTNISADNKTTNGRIVIETFNRTLLLALAAMTDKPDGIIGEWFKGCNGVLVQKKDETDLSSIAVKATADELIKYFAENGAAVFGNNAKSELIEASKSDRDYIKSLNLWIEKQKLCNELKYVDIKHEKKSIKLRKKILKASIADYEIEFSRLADAEAMLSEFKALHNID